MRKKIGKRIGPVPIALVAVLAVAAFISAGFWLVPTNSQSAEAQGLPNNGTSTKPTTGTGGIGGSGCGVTLDGDVGTAPGAQIVDGTTITQDAYVAGGKCNVNGDSIDVVLENNDEDFEFPLVVYVTGGNDFSSVQALVTDGDDADSVPDAAGEMGVDEHLVSIPKQANDFGSKTRGASTITVSRDMAGDDGEVYLFGYFNNDDEEGGDGAQQFLINGLFDVNRDGVISDSDDRGTTADAELTDAQIIDGKFNVVAAPGEADEAIDDNDDVSSVNDNDNGYVVIDGVLYIVSDAVDGAPPVALGDNTATAEADMGPIVLINGMADVNGDGSAANDDRDSTLTGTFNSDDDLAAVAIVNGGFDVDGDDAIETNGEDDYNGTRYVIRSGVVYNVMDNSGVSPVDLGASPMDTPGGGTDNPDLFARGSMYNVPFAPNTENFFPRVFTDTSGDPTSTGVDADLVILVRFQDPPAEKSSDGMTLSKVDSDPVDASGETDVTVMIRDANDVGLNGFATLTIAADAGDDVVFTESNLKTHRVEIDDGIGTAAIEGLPKTGAVRVEVTATFGDFSVSGYLTRLGRATSLDVMTYSCVTKIGNLPALMPDYICRIEAGTKAADLTEATSFAPGDKFLIVGTLKDDAGNMIDRRLNAGQLKPSGTTQAIENISDVTARPKVDAMSTTPAFPAISEGQANARLYLTVDDATNNAQLGDYEIEVSGGGQKQTVMITVSGMAENFALEGPSYISLGGSAKFTVTATDMAGNTPAGDTCVTVLLRAEDSDPADVSIKKESADPCADESKLKGDGTITFTVFAPVEAVEGARGRIAVLHNNTEVASYSVIFGGEPMMPGMPMNVMAEATSDTMITVSWESPADDGGSDITGYMVQRGYMDADNMMMWMDVDPAHMGMDMMYMDMGLMAETKYYYRVAAMNSSGMGDYSDGMAMAMTMEMPMMDELGTAMDVIDGFNRGGSLQVSWTKAANASGYIIIAINVNDVNGDVVSVPLNDGDLETWNIGGLTRGATYDIYVAATASGGRNTLSEAVRVTAQ